MKITELLNEAEKPKKAPAARKGSGGVRYNSEVGLLAGFMRLDAEKFNPSQPEKTMPAQLLEDPKAVYTDIANLLAPVFDEKLFNKWYDLGQTYGQAMHEKLTKGKRRVERFGWAGGANQSESGPSDVEFIGSDVAGVSVKESGGITLANLTTASVGLDTEYGQDVFSKYAVEDYLTMKRNIFTEVMNLAQSQPDVPVSSGDPKYTVTYMSATDTYKCVGKSTVDLSADDILSKLGTNAGWQRPFGNWFVANFSEYRHYSDPLFHKISSIFVETIAETLKDSSKLRKMLQFSKVPYFYATPKHLYYVPSYDEVDDLEVKDVTYADPDGTAQLFKIQIGRKDALDDATAELDFYIRYGNGMFETNPTVRVQSLKNPQFIAWEQLV
jgi:hypothetical protein